MIVPPTGSGPDPDQGPCINENGIIDLNAERTRRHAMAVKTGARLERLVKEAREHPLGLYRLCFTDDNGDPVILKWFHKEWSDMLLSNTHVMIEAPRGSTKCRTGNQRVLLSNGRHVPIGELAVAGEAEILSYDETENTLSKQSALIRDNGTKTVLRVVLKDGSTHTLTTNEPLMTTRGWVRADELELHDHVRCLRKDPSAERGRRRLPSGEGYILGYLAGDGDLSGTGIKYSCADDGVAERMQDLGEQICFATKKVEGDNVDWSTNGLSDLLKKYDIKGHTAHTKRHPDAVFGSSSKSIAEYLAGYWDADGTGLHDVAELSFTSCNRDLLEDTRYLTLKLERAAVGQIRDTSTKEHTSFKLTYYGRDALHLWYEIRRHVASHKAARLDASWSALFDNTPWLKAKVVHHRYTKLLEAGEGFEQEGKRVSQTNYSVPAEHVMRILHENGINAYDIEQHWFDPAGDAPQTGFCGQQSTYRHAIVHRLAVVCERYLDSPKAAQALRQAADDRYFWNKVCDVTVEGQKQTYALQSSKHQTYICEGAVTHNTTFLICCVLWFLGHNRELRIKLICGNDSNAAKRLNEIRSHINQDPLYQLVFPDIEEDPDETNNNLILNLKRKRHTKDSTIEAKGVMSDGTGDRADLIILDDVCTRKNSVDEPSTRPKVLGKLRSDWLNTINPRGGRVWSIFTPWHAEDANAVLKKETRGRWVYKRYAHGKPGDPYHSIFPQLFTPKWLRDKRLEIGALEYAQAYLCKAISGDIQIVRAPWLRKYNKLDIDTPLLQRATSILSIDPTGGKKHQMHQMRAKSDLDYYGIAIFLVDTEKDGNPFRPKSPNRIYLPDAYQVRLSTAHAAQHIVELHQKWQPDVVVIEAQGAQSIHEWIYERDSSLPIAPMPATISKKARLESVTPWLQDYRERVLFHPRTVLIDPQPFNVVIGGKDPTQAEARRTLRTQLLDFPTSHDDVMDAFVQGLRYIRQCVLPFDNTDEDAPPGAQEVDVDIRMIAI